MPRAGEPDPAGGTAPRAALAREFCRLRSGAEAGQLAAGVVFAAAVAAHIRGAALAWLAALGLAVLLARLLRLRAAGSATDRLLRAARWGVVATGLVWCAGLLWFLSRAAAAHRGVLLLVAAGLFAALASTAAADTVSHRAFSLLLVGGLLPPLLAAGAWREAAAGVVVALVMEWLRSESHRGLERAIAAQWLLARREAEADRERRELEQLFERSPWGFAVVDERTGRLLRSSRAFAALLGRSDPAGHRLSDLIPGFTLEEVAEPSDVVPLCNADGSVTWLRLASADVGGPGGPERLLLCEDVTARSLHQEAEQRYRELVESASDLVWRMDAAGRWTFLNQAASNIYGRPLDELLGRPALAQVAPEALEGARAAVARVLGGGRVADRETVHLHASGERRHLSFAAWPVRDAAGRVVGAQGIARDITARVAAREARASLARERAMLASLIDAVPDLVFAKDVESRYLWANAAFAEYIGRAPGEIPGLVDRDIVGDARGAALRQSDRDVVASGRPGRFEGWMAYADGRRILTETVVTPARSESGELVGLIGISRDVTDRRRAEDELKRLAARAEHATRMKSEFLALMSHEIRTPLHAVLGMLELLLAAPLPEEQRSQAEVARDSAHALLTLLGDILDFSRVEAGRLEVESTPFELSAVVEGVVAMMAPLAAESGNRLVLDLDPAVPRRVIGDGGRLRQVITNLVGNAGKFTQNGEIRLSAWSAAIAGRVRFEVCDDGEGIPEERLEAIFEPFTQADSSITRRFGGSGLGLAIARRLVALMGGELVCRSERGVGSAFSFELPLPEVPAGEPELTPRPKSVMDDGLPRRPLAVLLVEDNRVSQRVAQAMLERRGHEVVVAGDGHAALEAAAARRFDVVLMDVQMPGMDGLQATAALRDRGFATLPVVALTAHAFVEERERCLAAGMDDFLTKPFRIEDLVGVVERWGRAPALR